MSYDSRVQSGAIMEMLGRARPTLGQASERQQIGPQEKVQDRIFAQRRT
jgi:hypothetical protein